METKLYRCSVCGNVICKIVDSGVTPHCCGSPMVQLDTKSIFTPPAATKSCCVKPDKK